MTRLSHGRPPKDQVTSLTCLLPSCNTYSGSRLTRFPPTTALSLAATVHPLALQYTPVPQDLLATDLQQKERQRPLARLPILNLRPAWQAWRTQAVPYDFRSSLQPFLDRL
jgi:hypothetical protein